LWEEFEIVKYSHIIKQSLKKLRKYCAMAGLGIGLLYFANLREEFLKKIDLL